MKPRFFRALWRFNAIIIALLGIGGAALGLFAVADRWGSSHFASVEAPPIALSRPDQVRWEAGAVTEVPQTPYLILSIAQRSDRADDPSSFGFTKDYTTDSIDERNLIVIDPVAASTQWVLPSNERSIIRWDVLGTPDQNGVERGRLLFALVADSPEKRSFDLLVRDFQTGKQSWVAQNIATMDSPQLTKDGRFVFLATRAKQYLFVQVDLKTNTLREIPFSVVAPEAVK
jgi:hypothetical protein